MIFLIGGESHTGKTLLSQKLLEHLHYPYLSLDHLKMGFIRGITPPPFSVEEDSKIASFLWSITEGMIHTCLENQQNLIIEGVYLEPKRVRILLDSMRDLDHNFAQVSALDLDSAKNLAHDSKHNFESSQIKSLFLLFSESYIATHYDLIIAQRNAIEQRLRAKPPSKQEMIQDHQALKAQCKAYNLPFLEICEDYEKEIRDCEKEICQEILKTHSKTKK